MNKHNLLTQLKKKYNKDYIALCCLPKIDFISFMGDNLIFMRPAPTWDDLLEQLAYFDAEHLNMIHCYMNSYSTLAIKYTYKGNNLVFLCNQAKIALRELSNDSCEIKEIINKRKEVTISCRRA